MEENFKLFIDQSDLHMFEELIKMLEMEQDRDYEEIILRIAGIAALIV